MVLCFLCIVPVVEVVPFLSVCYLLPLLGAPEDSDELIAIIKTCLELIFLLPLHIGHNVGYNVPLFPSLHIDSLFFLFWPLCCLFFFDLRILITTLVSSTFSLFPIKMSIKWIQSIYNDLRYSKIQYPVKTKQTKLCTFTNDQIVWLAMHLCLRMTRR